MASIVEQLQVQVDTLTLQWLRDAASFDVQRRRFDSRPPPTVATTQVNTNHLCDSCAADLVMGAHWKCPQHAWDLCEPCKAALERGEYADQLQLQQEYAEHAQHGALRLFTQSDLDALLVRERDPTPSSAAVVADSGGSAAVTSATTASLSTDDFAMAATLDFTMPPEEVAPSGSLAQASSVTADQLTAADDDDSAAALSSKPKSGGLFARLKLKVSAAPLSHLRESLMSSEHASGPAAAGAEAGAALASSSSFSSAAGSMSLSSLHSAVASALQESALVVCLRSAAAVAAAAPAETAEGLPSHVGSCWLQSYMRSPPAGFEQQRAAEGDTSLRSHFHLLLVSRVRSLLPLLRWLQQRAMAGSAHDPLLPSLPLSNPQQLAALVAQLQCYSALLRIVQAELELYPPSAAAAPSALFSFWRKGGDALKSFNTPAHLYEDAATSVIPSLRLWLRLLEAADRIVAQMPLTHKAH